jgi:4-amino-4-deoxy-L-arabinose transferase-like glycosyltransferase
MGFETKLNKRVNRKRMLRQVLCIALLALAVRLFMYVLTVPNADLLSRDRDASQYHRWAHGLLGYGSFAKPWGDGEWHPDATYTPGYAAFLAAVYGLCGERPAAALAVQAVVNSVGIGCFYWICAHVVGLRLAFVAAILWAVDPFVALHDLTLMTEGIATLLVGLGLGILLLASEGPAPRAGLHAIYGMISGVGALIRPALQFWVVAALLPVLVKTIVRRWRMGVMAVAAAVSAYTGTILPWCLRNYLVVGTPKLTTFSGEQL